MKLYYSKGACSLAVRIIINEIGLTCEYESVNLKTKKTDQNQDFFQINPKGSVPVLVTDEGEILTENAIIQQYLADISQATDSLPAIGNFKRYRVLEWLNFISTDLHKAFGLLFNPATPENVNQTITIPLIKSKIAFINKHLHNHEYLMGDHFTLPDAYLFVILNWMTYFKIEIAEWSHLSHYYAELRKRPSVQQSLKEENH